ncbi:MAG: DDE-type integrase/transposase/recombinase [Leptolyngbyaceae cyanobacterium SM1_4_3]|nr:DDE-type integrase/transposase/recombinase [Leptolyngbyaceae cyanobacterium SM1_4_3]
MVASPCPYRAIDSSAQTLDFMLSAKRDAKAAKRFFKKVLQCRLSTRY